MAKAPRHRWIGIKAMIADIQPENSHYSRVQAMIRCGDEMVQELDRRADIIYGWHEKYTALSAKVKDLHDSVQTAKKEV